MATLMVSENSNGVQQAVSASTTGVDRKRGCDACMKSVLATVFTDDSIDITRSGSLLTAEQEQQFEEFCKWHYARIAFGRELKSQLHDHFVPTHSFDALAKLLRTVIQACQEAEHEVPVFHLLPAIFSVHTRDPSGVVLYMYSMMRDLHIWQSVTFWQAAFCHGLIVERRKRSVTHKKHNFDPEEEAPRMDTVYFDSDIVFAHIGTFLFNMLELGTAREIVDEFLDITCQQGQLGDERKSLLHTSVMRKCPIRTHVSLYCEPFWGFGLTLGEVDGSVCVSAMTWLGPASRSEQVGVGNLLLAIEGTDTSSMPLEQVRPLFDSLSGQTEFVFGS